MSDSVTVVIPWRDTGCTFRRRNLKAIRANVETLGWPVILADDPSFETFNLAAARNRGVEQAGADVVVVMDSDLLIPPWSISGAVKTAKRTGSLCYPYRRVVYLDEAGTQETLAGKRMRNGRILHKATLTAFGGCAILTKDAWAKVGGWDERFTGWGYEDNDFADRATATIGIDWGVGDVHHMWHPQSKRGEGYNRAILDANRAAREFAGTTDAFVIIPTHTQPDTLKVLIERAGLPCIVVHTDKKSRDIDGVINLRDEGPINIHRWWNLGIREAEARGAKVAVVCNHDATPMDDTQLPRMVKRTLETGATWGYVAKADTPAQMWTGKRLGLGYCWTLNLSHGLRPDENYLWYYGDELLDLQSRTQYRGATGIKVGITHHKSKRGPQYPAAFRSMVNADHERFKAEKAAILADYNALPDVVYRVRNGDNNDELRYSLRSLANLPHRHVWMVGHKPSWCSDLVRHIPGDRFPGKWSAIYDNVIRACEHPDISEDFLLVDDDVYVLQQIDAMPMWHLGSLQERLDGVTKNRGPDGDWQATLRATLDYLRTKGVDEPLSYEVHAPILINKATALPLLREAWSPDIHVQARSIYGNLANVGGIRHPDTKVVQGRKLKTEDVLSTTDASLRNLRHILESRFAKPCRYEVSE